MPKKGKGGNKEKKKEKKKYWLNERETLNYEQQILDNNQQLSRVRTRNEELEDEIEALKEKLRMLEEDRADVVAHLKRVLRQKTEEAKELGERLAALEELRRDEQVAYKKKEDAMELEYHNMEAHLSAEVKLAAGKLNALEDWRIARIDLMRKFEIQEEQMEEQKERHKQILYEAEKALIIGKAKMKKEMEERLNALSQSFRDATNIRIADATHRSVRENIALNRELDAMFLVCQDLETKTKESKDQERTLRLQASLFQNEAKIALNKALKQNNIINQLATHHFDMTLEYGKLQRIQAKASATEMIAQEYKEKSEEMQKNVRILEQHVQQINTNKGKVLQDVQDNCEEIERISRILREAQRCVAEALELQAVVADGDICTSCYPSVKEKLLYSLFDILGKEDIVPVTESKFAAQSVRYSRYTHGSLGLVPGRQNMDEYDGEEKGKEKVDEKETEKEKAVEEVKKEEKQVIKEPEGEPKEPKGEEQEGQRKIPECLLSDSESSGVLTPVETESTPSTPSEDSNL